jgi:hypothetical protein
MWQVTWLIRFKDVISVLAEVQLNVFLRINFFHNNGKEDIFQLPLQACLRKTQIMDRANSLADGRTIALPESEGSCGFDNRYKVWIDLKKNCLFCFPIQNLLFIKWISIQKVGGNIKNLKVFNKIRFSSLTDRDDSVNANHVSMLSEGGPTNIGKSKRTLGTFDGVFAPVSLSMLRNKINMTLWY